jgi:glycosyltransferase involved in cell wall biosynthesis
MSCAESASNIVAGEYVRAVPTLLDQSQPSLLTALSTPLTIMHLLAPAPVGGLETVVSTLSAAQSRAGHRVIVAPTLSNPEEGQPFIQSLTGSGVEVEALVVGGRAYLRERRMIRERCHSERVDIVHTHGYRSDIIGGSAARQANVPRVTTVHGFTGGGWKARRYEDLQIWSFRRFDAVVAVSRPLAAQLQARGVGAKLLHTIPNAFSSAASSLSRDAARRALSLPAEGVVVGWVGRVSREKAVDVFIDAMAVLGLDAVNAAVLGEGPERAREQARAQALVPDRLHWLGNVTDAARYFAAFDLLVLSSRTEGLPMVLLEAMAAAVPIVSTSVGGIPELLSAQEAILVAPDAPLALAAAIRSSISGPAAATARAEAARRHLRESYSVGQWSERYESLYRRLLDERSPPIH